MKPMTWINRLGTAIMVPSIIALFIIFIKLTLPKDPRVHILPLLVLMAIAGVAAILGMDLRYRSGKPGASATKPPSPAQEEEMREARGIVRMILEGLVFSFACGTIATLFGLKLIKLLVGVDSFGFSFWTWLSLHFVIFWIGDIAGIALVYLFLVLVARLSRATSRAT